MNASAGSAAYVSPLQLSRALGLGESTVKRWIDHGRIPASKTPGGHRRVPIPVAIEFVRSTGLELVDPTALGLLVAAAPSPGALRSLLESDTPDDVAALFERLYAAGAGPASLADDWIAPALATPGEAPAAGEIGVAADLQARSAAARALHALFRLQRGCAEGPLAFVAALAGDPHGLVGLCAELVLRGAGRRVVNLGAETSLDTLARAVAERAPRLVAIALGAAPGGAGDRPARARLRDAARSTGAALFVVGPVARAELAEALGAAGACRSMRELEQAARSLGDAGPARPAASDATPR